MDFQDGATASGATATHLYADPGAWAPVVTVQGKGNDSGGASQPIPVMVGAVPEGANSGRPGGTSRNKRAHTTGPTRSNGNTAGTAPTNRQTPPNATTSPPSASTPTSSPAASAHTPGTSAHRATKRVSPQPTSGATAVDGRLIADVIPVSPAQLATVDNPRTRHTRRRPGLVAVR